MAPATAQPCPMASCGLLQKLGIKTVIKTRQRGDFYHYYTNQTPLKIKKLGIERRPPERKVGRSNRPGRPKTS
jgi:hypothetical protein